MTRREVVGLICGLIVCVWALGGAMDQDARVAALQNRPYVILERAEKIPMALTRAERDWVEGLMDARDRAAIDGSRLPAPYADSQVVLARLNEIGTKVGLDPCP